MLGSFVGGLPSHRLACLRHQCAPQTAAHQRRPLRSLQIVARSPEAGVGIWGTKAGMTQIFQTDGTRVPVTVISLEAGNIVTQVCHRLALFQAGQLADLCWAGTTLTSLG